jgi:hypothetical protein
MEILSAQGRAVKSVRLFRSADGSAGARGGESGPGTILK